MWTASCTVHVLLVIVLCRLVVVLWTRNVTGLLGHSIIVVILVVIVNRGEMVPVAFDLG